MPLTHSAPDALARIYATSLFELAEKSGEGETAPQKCESTLGELEDILELARQDAKFGEFLASMILPSKERGASLRTMFQGRVSDLTLKFLLVLNDKERLGHLPAIVAAFEQMVQEAYGRVEVDVYTAHPIEHGEIGAIRTALQRTLGKEPVLHSYVDPSLIGGLKLQIGDQLIDGSIRTQLRKLRDVLSQDGGAEIRSRAARLVDGQ